IALHGSTTAARVVDGAIESFTLTPHDVGLDCYPLEALRGGTAEENARALRAVRAGGGSAACRDAIALNAGALLWVAGLAEGMAEGVAQSAAVLAEGLPLKHLDLLREMSHGT